MAGDFSSVIFMFLVVVNALHKKKHVPPMNIQIFSFLYKMT